MCIEIYIAISGLLGLLVGFLISKQGINERDNRIRELEYELGVKQNICDSNNDTINKLRRENERLKSKIKEQK